MESTTHGGTKFTAFFTQGVLLRAWPLGTMRIPVVTPASALVLTEECRIHIALRPGTEATCVAWLANAMIFVSNNMKDIREGLSRLHPVGN